MSRMMLLPLCLVMLLLPHSVHGQAEFHCQVVLSADSIVPPVDSPGTGYMFGRFDDEGAGADCWGGAEVDSLHVDCNYRDLLGDATALRVYRGAPWSGGMLYHTLASEYFPSGSEFDLPIDPQDCDVFLMELWVVVESDSFPSGEAAGRFDCHVTQAATSSWGSIRMQYR